jgi:hypothetical protein
LETEASGSDVATTYHVNSAESGGQAPTTKGNPGPADNASSN